MVGLQTICVCVPWGVGRLDRGPSRPPHTCLTISEPCLQYSECVCVSVCVCVCVCVRGGV